MNHSIIKNNSTSNVSLIKVSILVVLGALVSSIVNANHDVKIMTEQAPIQFSALVAELDTDKDGLLSQAEVAISESKLLQDEFKVMDLNGDNQISAEEFNHYLVKAKNSVMEHVKSNS